MTTSEVAADPLEPLIEAVLKLRVAQPEANAALGIVVDLNLPERNAIPFESLPTVPGIVGVLVDADLSPTKQIHQPQASLR